ncbi:MAG: hypothetical protein ACKOW9_03730 [Candidatus Paceibacterota bacterium]
MIRHKFSNQKGSMMIEVIVATAIITIAVLSATGVAQKSVSIARQSTQNIKAGILLEEGAEVVRITRDFDWANISGLTIGATYYPFFQTTVLVPTNPQGIWTLSSTPNTVDGFTRTVVFSAVNRDADTGDIVTSGGKNDPGTRLATVTVTWNVGAAVQTKSLSFYITDLF